MKFLKDMFSGGPDVIGARKKITKLRNKSERNKGTLRKVDQKQLDRSIAITRRHAIGLLVKGGVTAGIAIGGINLLFQGDEEDKTPPARKKEAFNPAPEGNESIEDLNILIQKAEAGMAKLEQRVKPFLEQVEDQHFREEMASPFVIAKINEANPHKNYNERVKKIADTDGDGIFAQENIHYYSYGLGSTAGTIAEFAPAGRLIRLSPSLDLDDVADMLVVYHELKHACNDAITRMGLDTKEKFDNYMAIFTQRSEDGERAVVLNEETTAYAYEVEMLNMLLKDELRQSISNSTPLNAKSVAANLGISKKSSIGIIEMLLEIANAYYPEGLTNKFFTERYIEHIKRMHRGLKFYVKKPNGIIITLEQAMRSQPDYQ